MPRIKVGAEGKELYALDFNRKRDDLPREWYVEMLALEQNLATITVSGGGFPSFDFTVGTWPQHDVRIKFKSADGKSTWFLSLKEIAERLSQ